MGWMGALFVALVALVVVNTGSPRRAHEGISPGRATIERTEHGESASPPGTDRQSVESMDQQSSASRHTVDWSVLRDDPSSLLEAAFDPTVDFGELSEEGTREFAHAIGMGVLLQSNMYTEESPRYQALLRLPSVQSLVRASNSTPTPADLAVIDGYLGKYEEQIAQLVPTTIEEANRLALAQYERREYKLTAGPSSDAAGTPTHRDKGLFSWSTSFTCPRTPYVLSFEFSSADYAHLESMFEEIARVKADMKTEVLGFLSTL